MLIPKTIHYCWFGRNPKPKLVKKCIKSWKKYFPDFEIKEWNETNFNVHCCRYVEEAYEAKKWAFVSDYARHWILNKYGGFYFDTDVEVIKEFSEELKSQNILALERNDRIASGLVMVCEPETNYCKWMLESYHADSFYKENGEFNFYTVCGRTTEYFEKYGFIKENKNQIVDGFHIYSTEYFCPKTLYSQKKYPTTNNTYTVHHYMASWLPSEEVDRIKQWKAEEKKYKRSLLIDKIIHLPNRIMKKILGKSFYSKVKAIIKK